MNCPNGHPVEPEHAFCQTCGVAVLPADPPPPDPSTRVEVQASAEDAPVPVPFAAAPEVVAVSAEPRRRRRSGRVLWIGIPAVVVVAGLVGIGIQVLGADTPEKSNTPGGTASSKLEPWDTPGGWDMDCSAAIRSDEVDVASVAEADVNNDGIADRVVVGSCFASTSSWPQSVAIWDGKTGKRTTVLDGAPESSQRPLDVKVSVVDGVLQVTGTMTSLDAPLCCPDLKFAASYRWNGEKYAGDPVVSQSGSEPTPAPTPTSSAARSVGYGKVKIGMSLAELQATGQVDIGQEPDGETCLRFPFSPGGEVAYSTRLEKVIAIFFGGNMQTSKGISLSSTYREAVQAYPEMQTPDYGLPRAPVAAGVSYLFNTEADGDHHSQIVLASDDQDCFE